MMLRGHDLPYWGQSLLRVLGGTVAVLLPAGTIVYLFLFKMMSFMQSRLGPMEAGPYGSMQLFAEVGKWLQKEDIQPGEGRQADLQDGAADRAGQHVPARRRRAVRARRLLHQLRRRRVLHARRVSSISTLGILIAGWSSANKYSLLGGLRAAGQLIAYELPMVLAVVGVVIQAGTMNMQEIVVAQNAGEIFGWDGLGNPYILTQFVGFVDLHDRRAGRAHADAVRHADRRVRARVRLHDRVLRLPLPHLLHRRVRHGRRVRADRQRAVPRRLGRAVQLVRLGRRSTTSTTG